MTDYISREAAIKALGERPLNWCETDMEIQAVYDYDHHVEALRNVPAADVKPVVYCKDCKYGDTGTDEDGNKFLKCIGIHYGGTKPEDFCSYGEPKTGADMRGADNEHID